MSGIEGIPGFGGEGDGIDKSLEKLFDSDKLAWISDLSMKEIRAIAIILFLSDYLQIPEYKTLVKNVMKLKVSKDRKGRKELISMFTGLKEVQEKAAAELNNKLVR